MKAPVLLKELGYEEDSPEVDPAVLKCLRPALVSLVLVDIIKRKFGALMEKVPELNGEH